MLSALLRYPKQKRREVAQGWAARSNAAQSEARMAAGPDEDTLYRRALDDARARQALFITAREFFACIAVATGILFA